jgi:NAD(P)-dependent dehydrogenase (short-subunit alcohol dehydrogenase family)
MKKIAIVTGASRGIGRSVAKRLAQDGFAAVVNYLSNASEAEEVVAEIKVIGGEAIAVKADVANQTGVERLFEETMKKFGSVDVVVHNSGIMPLSPIGKSDVELFDKVISTNLRGGLVSWRERPNTSPPVAGSSPFQQCAGQVFSFLRSIHCVEGGRRRLGACAGERTPRTQS